MMDLLKIINHIIRQRPQPERAVSADPPNRFHQDIYFTANFRAKARECGLTEAHARRVYYEGDRVKGKGKENMKVMPYKGEEIGIYAFHDRETNQPVVTSIWRRKPRTTPRR